jgi:hypothetical protein
MATANVGASKAGSFSTDLSSADDFWRKLLNNEPSPATKAAAAPPSKRREDDSPVMGRPRVAATEATTVGKKPTRQPSDFYRQETGVGLVQAIEKAQSKSAGFVFEDPRLAGSGARTLPVTKAGADPWARGEKRLWVAAGLLMGLAAMVLGMFALVTFGGFHIWGGASASVLPAAASSPDKPVVVVAPPEKAAPVANTTTPAWRPMVPARARSAEKSTLADKKKTKHHKSGKSLLRSTR